MPAHALKRPVLLTLCACVLVAQSMVAAINLLIPQLSSSALHPSHTEILWTVDAYVIVFAGLLVPAGALGDRYGRKGALLVGLGLFAAGAAASALAPVPAVLITGRGLSGAGAALITPATLSILMQLSAPGHRARSMAAWTLAIGLGGAAGNLGGGLAGQFLTWRALFAVMVPLAAVLAVAVAVTTPRTARSARSNPDPLGALLLTAGLAAGLFGIIEGPVYGWTSARILGAFAAGALLISGFVRHALRAAAPLFDPRVFASARLRAASLGTATGFFGLFSLFFLNSQYLQDIKGFGAAVTGVAILPLPVGMAVAQKLAARWADRPRAIVGTGLSLIGLGLLGASGIDASTPYWAYAGWLLLISAGTGLSMPALTLGVVTSLPAHQTGLGSGLGTTARETGAALGVAVTGTVLSSHADLAHGMGPALRTVALVVLAATVLVVTGYGAGSGSSRTVAAGRERDLTPSSRP
ncbi:MFS transporter [Streptomyces pluripotens]|uniref:MFS transporter n=1 Tax=Streptomyces pluripotens TaxID=1355015 RepID=A0A221P251_9ACTN|nr:MULTISPECIES: MFS transporter [Streptomyces]ARP71910.1 MFS transporter [Streptomyces pluripotens]ASN26156.1 MFS transporter [Streptomyces pluripotens]KIE26327.1 MFS transporter [Streptomyces sp. MUSC 125]MCH0556398.1 MFS transporter [Streptomyces sp. MUM 16J]